MKIAIVDYGLGNVKSVANALNSIGATPVLTSDAAELGNASALIIPGVGAFGDGMANIHERGLYDVIIQEAKEKGKPLLGICLGMQLLADGSDEFGKGEGFGFIPGWVEKIKPSSRSFKVPHIGWNNIEITIPEPLFTGVEQNSDCYFVHSYHYNVENEENVSAWCNHGERFAAAVQKDNIMGAQFHPEKSQKAGIALLENFYRFAKSC